MTGHTVIDALYSRRVIFAQIVFRFETQNR